MFDKILVPVKLTIDFEIFMEYLSNISELGIKEIHLINVIEVKFPQTAEIIKEFDKDAFERQKEIWAKKNIKVILHSPNGKFHEEINRIIKDNNIDLIVTASQSESLLYEMLLDPMSDNLIRNAVYPILTLNCQLDEKRKIKYPVPGKNLFEKILFTTDFSNNAEYALDTALIKIVKKKKSSVILFHVQEDKRILPHLKEKINEFNIIDNERLGRIKKKLLEAGAKKVEIKIVNGHAFLAILEEINQGQPTMVLMGNQGRNQIQELFIGSVAHNVARKSTVPVYLVPWRKKVIHGKLD